MIAGSKIFAVKIVPLSGMSSSKHYWYRVISVIVLPGGMVVTTGAFIHNFFSRW